MNAGFLRRAGDLLERNLYIEAAEIYEIAGKSYPEIGRHFEDFSIKLRRRATSRPGVGFLINDDAGFELPVGFNSEKYLKSNPDLKQGLRLADCSDNEKSRRLKSHYLEYGEMESRNWFGRSSDEDIEYRRFTEKCFVQYKYELYLFLSSNKKLSIGGSLPSDGRYVSVIVVLHNQAHLTLKAIESLSNSYLDNMELIIINNASSDETIDLIGRLEGNIKVITNLNNIHFLEAANQGAAHATGNYLIFLNNDAIVEPGAIAIAIDYLECSGKKNIALGGKICHFDGLLQEAGSVVFIDGSTKGVGRGEPSDKPIFNYIRKVDYVSGCLLVIDRNYFNLLSGFATDFAPAYYEETDLCARIWQDGGEVIYHPGVGVRHLEFGSVATGRRDWDPRSLMKRNRAKFISRNESFLTSCRPSNKFSPFDPQCIDRCFSKFNSRKVLVIDDRIADGSFGAGSARMSSFLSALSRKGFFTTFVSTDVGDQGRHIKKVHRDFEIYFDGWADVRKLLRDERKCFYEYIVVSRRHNQENFINLINEFSNEHSDVFNGNRPKFIADVEALFSVRDISKAYLDKTGKIFELTDQAADLFLQNAMFKDELKILSTFDRIIAVSQFEADLISKGVGRKACVFGHSFCIERGNSETRCLDIGIKASPSPEVKPVTRLGFIGSFHSAATPNFDSIIWFLRSVVPAMIINHPFESGRLEIVIAGICESECLKKELDIMCQESRISAKYIGNIGCVEEFYRMVDIIIIPARYAAGIPYKLHEAAAHQKPIVTTKLIALQVGWEEGIHLLVGNSSQDFAEAVVKLIKSPDLCQLIVKNALLRLDKDVNPISNEKTLDDIFRDDLTSIA
jgi:GT2 family glycosyltransferase